MRGDPSASTRGLGRWILFDEPESTSEMLFCATCILHLYTIRQNPGHLASKCVQRDAIRIDRKRPEIPLLTEGEEICPKGVKQFRVRCLQPLSHPSATRFYWAFRSVSRSPICHLYTTLVYCAGANGPRKGCSSTKVG